MAKIKLDELMSVGIDIGKDTFHIVAIDPYGQLVMRKQIKRLALEGEGGALRRAPLSIERSTISWREGCATSRRSFHAPACVG